MDAVRSRDLSSVSEGRTVGFRRNNLFSHFPEEFPEAAGLLEASSPLRRQLTQLLVAEVHVSDSIADDLRVAGFITWRGQRRAGVSTNMTTVQ